MEEYDEKLCELSTACPFLGGNPSHCQLHELRKRNYLDQLSYLAHLSIEEKEEMYHCHEDCLKQLEAHALAELSEHPEHRIHKV